MIVVIIKTVVLTLCILAVLLMFFVRKYDFCVWKKYKIPKVYFSDNKYVYDKFNYLVNKDNTKCRSRIEIDFENNTIRIETEDSSEVLTYTFSKYAITDEEGHNIEFMFEDGYEIERASLELRTWRNELLLGRLEITTKHRESLIQYF
jgi:hypothetical protein